jgi:hypothetical protein
VRQVIVFRGGMSARERESARTALLSTEPGERLVLATDTRASREAKKLAVGIESPAKWYPEVILR